MQKKELTTVQIEKLFRFMRQKYVRYYDVQIELVDHFATGIETVWEKDPNISFEQAIAKIYGGFPVTGFNNLIQAKQTAIQKRITRAAWQHVKDFFHWPKIMATFLATVLICQLYTLIPYPLIAAYIITTRAAGITLYQLYQYKKNRRKEFLTLNVLAGSEYGFTFVIYISPQFLDISIENIWIFIGLSVLTVVYLLLCRGHYLIAQTIYKDMRVQFPKYI